MTHLIISIILITSVIWQFKTIAESLIRDVHAYVARPSFRKFVKVGIPSLLHVYVKETMTT